MATAYERSWQYLIERARRRGDTKLLAQLEAAWAKAQKEAAAKSKK